MSRLVVVAVFVALAVLFTSHVSGQTPKECDTANSEYDKAKCQTICLNDKEYTNASFCLGFKETTGGAAETAPEAPAAPAAPSAPAKETGSSASACVPSIVTLIPVTLYYLNKAN